MSQPDHQALLMAAMSAPGQGNLAVLSAMALFVVNDALVKLATTAYPTGQVLALRGVFASLVTFGLVVALGQTAAIPLMLRPRVLLRAALEGLVAFTFITALARLPIANITAILQASSLIIVAFAALLGIDRIGWRRGLAIMIGFTGVLLVVRPSAGGFNLFSLLALAAAILVAVRDLLTRHISADIPSGVVAFGTTLAVMIAGCIFGLAETWHPLQWRETIWLILAAVAVALGNTCIIIAYRKGDVSIVSGLRYSVMVFALLAGFIIWGEWPDALAILGSVLIVGSGLYAMHRQAVKHRQALKPAAGSALPTTTPAPGGNP